MPGSNGNVIWEVFYNIISISLDAKNRLVGGWVAGTVDPNQYVEIHMESTYKFTQIHIQGRDDAEEWVTSFKLLYYDSNSSTWLEYIDGTGQNVCFSFIHSFSFAV